MESLKEVLINRLGKTIDESESLIASLNKKMETGETEIEAFLEVFGTDVDYLLEVLRR